MYRLVTSYREKYLCYKHYSYLMFIMYMYHSLGMEMYIRTWSVVLTRDVHGNGKCRIPIPHGIPMGVGTKLHKLMGMGREWE